MLVIKSSSLRGFFSMSTRTRTRSPRPSPAPANSSVPGSTPPVREDEVLKPLSPAQVKYYNHLSAAAHEAESRLKEFQGYLADELELDAVNYDWRITPQGFVGSPRKDE